MLTWHIYHVLQARTKIREAGREGGEEKEKRDTERICAYVCTSLR